MVLHLLRWGETGCGVAGEQVNPAEDQVIVDGLQGEGWRQHRKIQKNDNVSVFDSTTDSWRTVKITSHQIKFYKKNGSYHNVRFEDGTEAGFYFRPGESWSIIENEEIQQEIQQLDGGITPESLTPDSSPNKSVDIESDKTPATLPCDTLGEETPRQTRQKNRELRKSRINKTYRVYNLRSTTANPIDETDFIDENYSDMDSVFGGTQEEFNYQLDMPRMNSNHINLGIPSDMLLVRDRKHSLTEYLDIELPRDDRGFSDHIYRLPPEFETTRFTSASNPDLVGEDPESSRTHWFRTYQSLRDLFSCIGRLRIFRNRRRQ